MGKQIRQTIEFDLGTTLHIERQIGEKSVRGTSKIIGAHDPRFLLIDMPFSFGKPMFSTAGDNCIVRFLHHGTLLGFWADVVKIHFDPFPIVLLEYPKEIEEMALRKHERLHCSIPAMLAVPEPTEPELVAYIDKLAAPKKAQDGLAALTGAGEDEDTVPSVPSAPLHVTVVDLAKGGCQLAVQTFDPQNFGERALEARKHIPVAERANYHVRALRVFCAKGRPATLDVELPQPSAGQYRDIPVILRWNKVFGDHFLAGLSFECEDDSLSDAIEAIIAHQQKFFTRHFEPVE